MAGNKTEQSFNVLAEGLELTAASRKEVLGRSYVESRNWWWVSPGFNGNQGWVFAIKAQEAVATFEEIRDALCKKLTGCKSKSTALACLNFGKCADGVNLIKCMTQKKTSGKGSHTGFTRKAGLQVSFVRMSLGIHLDALRMRRLNLG